jgi:hypothetical protein
MDGVTATPARPRDVVLASALTIFGSVFALAGIFTAQGEIRTAQVRQEIEGLLADDRFSAIDISVDTVLTAVEIGLMGASTASVAAIVLAVFVLRRHNASRIALTVLGGLAVLAVLLSGLAGVVIAIFVAYTVSLLWRAPVRGWFAQSSGSGGGESEPAGDQPNQPPSQPPSYPPGQPPSDPHQEQPEQQAAEQPNQPDPYRPQPGRPPGPFAPPGQGLPPGYPEHGHGTPSGYPEQQYGAQPSHPRSYPQPYPQAHGYGYPQGYGYGYPPMSVDPDRRPPQLVTAHVLTWVGVAFGLFTGVFFLAASGSQEILDLAMEQLGTAGLSADQLATMLRFAGVVMALWSVAVAVVSVFSWRRANWAAILLTVMGGLYLLMQLFALVTGQLAVLFTIVWVAAVIVLMWWPTSRQWYAGRGRSGQPGAYGGPSYPQERKRNQPW